MKTPAFIYHWMANKEQVFERFKSKIIKLDNGCWDLDATLKKSGYKHFTPYHNITMYAHRIAYQIFKGTENLDKMLVLHTCDNRWCVNPEHLYLGVQKDNVNDAIKRNRKYTKISTENVAEIFYRYFGGQSANNICKIFNVGENYIHQIIRGETWKGLAL